MLRDIDAELVDIRRGAWQTFRSESADSMRQAFHSMRELVRELLKRIAPDDQVKRAPWYQLPKGTVSPVTRKQRARFVLVGFDTANPRSRVDSLAKWLELVEQSLNSAYGQLSAVAHGERLPAAESYLHLAEDLVMILLSSRVSPEEER